MKAETPAAIRVKIVHQSRIMRECLAAVLSDSGRFAVELVDHCSPDLLANIVAGATQVLLIDLDLPNQLALGLTRDVHDRPSAPGIVLLTHTAAHDDLIECFAAGAHGCVPEDSSVQELCDAIETVAKGGIYCSPGIVHSVFHRMSRRDNGEDHRKGNAPAALTPRELEIVSLIGEHLSNKQIAKRLSVSLYTIKNHVHNIVEKLQVSGRYEAVDYVRKHHSLRSVQFSRPGQRND